MTLTKILHELFIRRDKLPYLKTREVERRELIQVVVAVVLLLLREE